MKDFLKSHERLKTLESYFPGHFSVKHAIEPQRIIPHSEIDLILVNGIPVGFEQVSESSDFVSVYPMFESIDISNITKVRQEPIRITMFILKAHFSKVVEVFRLIGIRLFI
ncbi:MAG: hypothetical protein JEZ03_13015 [Bacteroidales bacterium]|nr:hypothetical protein [Bacteroidales bacterium]